MKKIIIIILFFTLMVGYIYAVETKHRCEICEKDFIKISDGWIGELYMEGISEFTMCPNCKSKILKYKREKLLKEYKRIIKIKKGSRGG